MKTNSIILVGVFTINVTIETMASKTPITDILSLCLGEINTYYNQLKYKIAHIWYTVFS